jgi:hypothetical protein
MWDVNWLRPQAVDCGFGPMLNCRLINGSRRGGAREDWNVEKVSRYVTRYICRDMPAVEEDKGVRLVDYLGSGARRATVSFRWAKGVAFLWRRGRAVWSQVFGPEAPSFEDFWTVVRLGWEDCSEEERRWCLETSAAVLRWWSPESIPF